MKTMTDITSRVVPDVPGEIRLFAIARNEETRLPFFLRYYKSKGVDRFFIVNNDSTDSTSDILAAERSVHAFHTSGGYAQSEYGIAWLRHLMNTFGIGYWCIVADIDEMLVYPRCEDLSLRDICDFMLVEGKVSLRALLIDMYSSTSFEQTKYLVGDDPLQVCPYFETRDIICSAPFEDAPNGEWKHNGGMRRRVFGINPRLDKVSILKYDASVILELGMHSVRNAPHSAIRGAVLHFKYFSDFVPRVGAEALREEHWREGLEYKRYYDVLSQQPQLGAWTPQSRQYCGTDGMTAAGVTRTSPLFDGWVKRRLEER